MSKNENHGLRVIHGGRRTALEEALARSATEPRVPPTAMPADVRHKGPQPVALEDGSDVDLTVTGYFNSYAHDLFGSQHYIKVQIDTGNGQKMCTWISSETMQSSAPKLSEVPEGHVVKLQGTAASDQLYRGGDIPLGEGTTSVVQNAHFVVVPEQG